MSRVRRRSVTYNDALGRAIHDAERDPKHGMFWFGIYALKVVGCDEHGCPIIAVNWGIGVWRIVACRLRDGVWRGAV